MAWDWTVRLVLPVLMVLLAAVIYEIVRAPRAAMSGMERVAIALLAVTLLGMAGWWATSWLLSNDIRRRASRLRRGRREDPTPP